MPTCAHLDDTPMTAVPDGFEPVCTDCVAAGGYWVHLRRCLTCQQVSCCDSSPARHATAHAALEIVEAASYVTPHARFFGIFKERVKNRHGQQS